MNSKSKKGLKILGGSLLTLAIVALLSITYATYTQTLNITGAGTVKAAKWDISFNEVTNVTVTTDSAEEGYKEDIVQGETSISGTTLSIQNAELKRPGDSITYEFEAENKGDFDAILSAVNTTLTCKTVNEETDKTQDCQKHIKVSLMDSQGTPLATSDGQTYTKDGSQTHTLIHKTQTKEKFKLKIEYKKDEDSTGNSLPTEDLKITEFGATLTYNQYTAS